MEGADYHYLFSTNDYRTLQHLRLAERVLFASPVLIAAHHSPRLAWRTGADGEATRWGDAASPFESRRARISANRLCKLLVCKPLVPEEKCVEERHSEHEGGGLGAAGERMSAIAEAPAA